MQKKDMNDLRAKYPEEYYDIVERNNKLTITEKKAIIWLPKFLLKEIPAANPQKLSNHLADLVAQSTLAKADFEFEQKVISEKCSQLINGRARACVCTKKDFVKALLEEDKAREKM